MTPKITKQMQEALRQSAGKPVEVEDDASHATYVLVPLEEFRKVERLLSLDETDPSHAYPLVDETFGGPEGWDAPGMDAYDDYDTHRQRP